MREGHRHSLLLAGALSLLVSCSADTAYFAARGTKRHEGQRSGEAETGTWTYWYENAQVRERGEYEDGQRTGIWTQWHRNGQLLSRGERVWDEVTGGSLREGPWVFWHENGSVRGRGAYVRGREEGAWAFWTERGQVDAPRTGNYRSGERRDDAPTAPVASDL